MKTKKQTKSKGLGNDSRQMIYKATIKENLGLFSIFGFVGVFSLWIGLHARDVALAGAGAMILSLLLLIRLRLYVHCTADYLEARSLIRTRRIAWSEIGRIVRAEDTGYWASRIYGPVTYHIETPSNRVTINFKFYSLDCLRAVFSRLDSQGLHLRKTPPTLPKS